MAEQEKYGSYWGSKPSNPTREPVGIPVPTRSGAEQDRFASHFGQSSADNPTTQRVGIPVNARGGSGAGAEQDVYTGHFGHGGGGTFTLQDATTVGLGLVRHAVLPSLGFHAGLSVAAYGVSRLTDRVDGKDWLWPVGPVANAWWSAVGSRVVSDGVSPSAAWSSLPYADRLLLGGVTAWGARLLYRVVQRSLARGGDDARYVAQKKQPGFWNRALFGLFVPEAVFQTLISLPFVLPFRAPYATARGSLAAPVEWACGAGVFLYSAGFALETLADYQLTAHQKSGKASLNREGVWSIVRHPNYLGDALTHLAFPLFLLGTGRLHPLVLLGPAANYVFLRFISGDKENEASQEERYAASDPLKAAQLRTYKLEKNSFWPNIQELANPWTLVVAGVGVVGVVVERALRP